MFKKPGGYFQGEKKSSKRSVMATRTCVFLGVLCHFTVNISISAESLFSSKKIRRASLQPEFLSPGDEPREPSAPNFDQMIQDSVDVLNKLNIFQHVANAESAKAIVLGHTKTLQSQNLQQTQQSQKLPSLLESEKTKNFEDTIFVVRAHRKCGTAMLDHYATQLRGIAAVWCIYDTTRKADKTTIDNMRALERRNNNFHFLTIDDTTIQALLPNAKWPWKSDHVHITPSISYYMHTPSIIGLFKARFGKVCKCTTF